ncbi:nucleotidyltransferase family protein [Pinibacter aurantiacus]|uniref:Uncharacterized protein n=1 Tax=Pinibacter aurantiacus TaxID=2851599 RepID=A0A9E2SGV7_9BACT|nr:hypothetical protein [Pinibacter aurantiacus]MBV4360610.1 hypothetical protein [Pinibacter aurantiacus]
MLDVYSKLDYAHGQVMPAINSTLGSFLNFFGGQRTYGNHYVETNGYLGGWVPHMGMPPAVGIAGGVGAFGTVEGAIGVESVLSEAELLRIENAATRIQKPINIVGSRAKGTANAYSDWDYVIEGLTNQEWKQIKNSLPGSGSVLDNTPRNIDIFKGPVLTNYPYITINPR